MNFVCTVFELGDKMLTLSSMENLIVQCNLKGIGLQRLSFSSEDGSWRDKHFATIFMKIRQFIRKL